MTNSEHDKKVREIAQSEEKQGRNVQADVPGFNQPRTIYNRRPDVISLDPNTGIERIIEVETPSSLKNQNDKRQRDTLRNFANRSNKRKFRTIVTSSKQRKSTNKGVKK